MTLEASFQQTPHDCLTQHRKRRLGTAAKGRIKLETRFPGSCRASAETNNNAAALSSSRGPRGPPYDNKSQPPLTAPRGSDAVLQQHADVPVGSPGASSGIDPKLAAAVRLVLGGAVAMAAIAVGYEVGANLVSSLESVPPLAHLELLIGTLVSARALALYFGDSQARSEVEGKVVSAVEGVKGVIGIPDLKSDPVTVETQGSNGETANGVATTPATHPPPHPTPDSRAAPKLAPTMLEVEIRSLVDEAMAAAQDTPEPSVVTVDRRALVDAVAEYIRKREQHTREGLEKVREELEESETLKQSLIQLTKTREARRARRAAESAAMERLQRLQEENSMLLESGVSAALLAEEMEGIQGSLSNLNLGFGIDARSDESIDQSTLETTKQSPNDEDDLESAMERARRFRAKLDAMKKAKEKRSREDK